jgi:hypothetical protein
MFFKKISNLVFFLDFVIYFDFISIDYSDLMTQIASFAG